MTTSKNNLILQLKSFDALLLEKAYAILEKLSKKHNMNIQSYFRLPIHIKKFTFLRSPHIYKKSREQFEIRTYKRLISFKKNSTLLTQIELNNFKTDVLNSIPAGISLKIIFSK